MAATKKKRSKPRTKVLSAAAREAREKAIVADLKSGELSYRQIAQKHGVSLPTVNNKARKFGISRGRRPGAKILVPAIRRSSKKTGKTASRTVRKAVKKAGRPGRKPGRPRKTVSASVNGAGFASAFRTLLLEYYPNISLKQFEKLNEVMERELA
ncbi:MAG: hypothetical protein H6682_17180 [Candidatus Eisenbacteria bacterium]|nr:hypothetical protein [Candidatus Eisenbacteria bacterium]